MLGSSGPGHWRRRGTGHTHGEALGVKNLANLVGCLMRVHNLPDIWSTFVCIWYIEYLNVESTQLSFLWWLEWSYAVLSKTSFWNLGNNLTNYLQSVNSQMRMRGNQKSVGGLSTEDSFHRTNMMLIAQDRQDMMFCWK